jgi:hypothetical protein
MHQDHHHPIPLGIKTVMWFRTALQLLLVPLLFLMSSLIYFLGYN